MELQGLTTVEFLNSLVLPPNTLCNSNINYVLWSEVSKIADPLYYIALLNSYFYDQLIRIEKKTNHNSSAMLANLPIPMVHDSNKKGELVDSLKIKTSEMRSKDQEFSVSSNFSSWLSLSSILSLVAFNKLNLTVFGGD